LKSATGGTVGLFTRDLSDQFLVEQSSLIESNKSDWFGHLVTSLEASFPDISTQDDNSPDAADILVTGEYCNLSINIIAYDVT